MKLERVTTATTILAAALALAGCSASARAPGRAAPLVPMTDVVSTTTITSALTPDGDPGPATATATATDAPRVSKAQRTLDASASSQTWLDPKRSASREGKRGRDAFAAWK